MTGETNSYVRAVALFEAILQAPVTRHRRRPADVANNLGRARTTGYRALSEAEATGLLQRDLNQSYRRGLVARRIGFAATGFGAMADVAEPILTDLREALRMTTLFGVIREQRLMVGPFSIGRGAGYVRPELGYRLAVPLIDTALTTMTFLPEEPQSASIYARTLVLDRNAYGACILAVLSARPIVGPVPSVDEALSDFERRMSSGGAS